MDLWHGNWMGTGALCHRVQVFHKHLVADFVTEGTSNVRMLNQFLNPAVVNQVLSIVPPSFKVPIEWYEL